MKKKIIACVLIFVILIATITLLIARGPIKYSMLSEEDLKIIFSEEDYNPGNGTFVSKLLDIDTEEAVRIAQKAWSPYASLDKFKVYYDAENDWYFVYAHYILPEDRLEYLFHVKYSKDDVLWEKTCTTLIDKNSGAVLNMDGWGIVE